MNEAIAALLPVGVRVITLLISVTIHEFSHGMTAFVQGDRTAHDQGRLTLNPIAHMDPIGSILVPAMLILVNSPFIIGWAKPVPYNPYNLRNRRWGALLVSLAGPVSNIILFLLSALLLKSLIGSVPLTNYLMIFLSMMTLTNISLAIFNLIPVPPLDGSGIMFGLMPPRMDHIKEFLQRNALYLFVGLILLDFQFHFLSPFIASIFVSLVELLQIPLSLPI